MPTYKFITTTSSYDALQLLLLYNEQNWWGENSGSDVALVKKIVKGSYLFLTAWDGDKIIGMARAISDGVSDAYIQDVAVRIRYRNNGTGALLIQKLTERLKKNGIAWIGLIAENGSEAFYLKQGFKKMSGAAPMLKLDL